MSTPITTPTKRLSVIPLGGSGEFGLNTLVYEYGDDIVVVDSGAMFAHEHQPGVGLIVPDISYITSRPERVRGVILSHGHEDHTAGLSRLLRLLPVPVFGTALTLGLVSHRLGEHGMLKGADLRVIHPSDVLVLGGFDVSFIPVSHSIPGALAIVLRTAAGTIVHAGEFKWDQSDSYNTPTDIEKLADLGRDGVLLLVADSTNADRPGTTSAEHELGPQIDRVFREAKGRVIVSAFASHLLRIQQFIDVAVRHGRSVALAGRALVQNVKVASDLGYLKVPAGVLVELAQVTQMPAERIAILCTGSQAEKYAALPLLARGEHRYLHIEPGDTVVISARVIPGNERSITQMISQLLRSGAEVRDPSSIQIHVSGHAAQDDLCRMIQTVKPRFLLPIHGEYRNLIRHADVAVAAGMARERVVIAEDGQRVSVTADSCAVADGVPAKPVMLGFDGESVITELDLHNRQKLSRNGVCAAVAVCDWSTRRLAEPLRIVSVGIDATADAEEIVTQATAAVSKMLEARASAKRNADEPSLEDSIAAAIARVIGKRTGRKPTVLPIVIASSKGGD